MNREFNLCLFSVDPQMIAGATAGGISTVVVDWERIGKRARQTGADTEINGHTPAELRRVREATTAHVICRINNVPGVIFSDIEQAVDGGADEILVPMVHTAREVERVLDQVAGRCDVGILIETNSAVARAGELSQFPLSRIYVGLNDLALARRTPNLFTSLVDGTVETVRQQCGQIPFGFGGLTVPERGAPIPCRLLMSELARLDCSFTFLRRSFHRDVQGRNVAHETSRIVNELREVFRCSPLELGYDRRKLVAAVANWSTDVVRQPGAIRRAAA
jgi:HpcH/HpaI aldolase/citrate lyase family